MCKFSIVIVSYNIRELLLKCLRSVYAALGDQTAEVWVVDNASTDDSVEQLRREFSQVKLIVNDTNLGFSRANNQAMRQAQGKIWVLLNPDTIVLPGAFQKLMEVLESEPSVGVAGPKVLNPDRSIQPSFGRFSSFWTEFFFQFYLFKFLPSPFPLGDRVNLWQRKDYQQAKSVDWVSGACMAISPEATRQVGFFDENLFMYGEDMELCWRIAKTGFTIKFCPDAQVIHLGRQSSRRDYSTWISRYTWGQLLFIKKHRAWIEFRLCGVLVGLGSVIRLIAWGLLGFVKPDRRNEVRQRLSGYQQAIKLGFQAAMSRSK
jgi:GT2 family glycosyltransferase